MKSEQGSEFIGTWYQVNNTIDLAPNPWTVNFKDGSFYINVDPQKIQKSFS